MGVIRHMSYVTGVEGHDRHYEGGTHEQREYSGIRFSVEVWLAFL